MRKVSSLEKDEAPVDAAVVDGPMKNAMAALERIRTNKPVPADWVAGAMEELRAMCARVEALEERHDAKARHKSRDGS